MARSPKTWRAWTRREITLACDLRLTGLTSAEVAARLGRTVPSVKCLLDAQGVRRFLGRAAEYLEHFNRPHAIKGVAAALGVTPGAVKQMKRRLRRAGCDVLPADWAGPPRIGPAAKRPGGNHRV